MTNQWQRKHSPNRLLQSEVLCKRLAHNGVAFLERLF